MEVTGFSVAGIETCLEVPTLGMVLDLGRCSRTAVNHPVVLVSHGHLDHIGAIAQHAARRAMMNMSEGIYLVPKAVASLVEALFNAAGALDGQTIPRTVVPLEVGEQHRVAKNRWVQPFKTFHRVPSHGYTVWERRHKLRDEFVGQAPQRLGELRRQGVAIDMPVDVPLLSFTGDTRVEVLEANPELQRTEQLVMETTFVDERVTVESAREMGHIHLDEVLARIELLPRSIVLSHFSARYTEADVRRIFERRMPEELRERIHLLAGRASD